jgi:hypothetical protein
MSHHHHHHYRAQPPFRFNCNTITTASSTTDAPPIGVPQHHHPTNEEEEEDTIPDDHEKPYVAVTLPLPLPLLPITIFRQGWQSVLQLLQGRQQIAILTGAGMSVSCGIPDFRSQGSGLYATLDTHVRYYCDGCGGYCGCCCIILVMPVCVCVC